LRPRYWCPICSRATKLPSVQEVEVARCRMSQLAVHPSTPDKSDETGSPSVTFDQLTFSDGSVITLSPNDIVVIVGPNNAGKSAALRELEKLVGPSTPQTVITSAALKTTGSTQDVLAFIRQHRARSIDSGRRRAPSPADFQGSSVWFLDPLFADLAPAWP
jgi:ATPase subunit of ABC transporter with duplicated ATPase domains